MPARLPATNRQPAVNRQLAVGRLTASNRQNVSGGGGGAADDMIFLDEQIVSGATAANLTFSAISGSYRHLWIEYSVRLNDATPVALVMQFNGDTGANYEWVGLVQSANGGTNAIVGAQADTSIRVGRVGPSGAPAGSFTGGYINLPYYDTTTQSKSSQAFCSSYDSGSTAFVFKEDHYGMWATSNAAITSIVLFPTANLFVQNSRASLYGIT